MIIKTLLFLILLAVAIMSAIVQVRKNQPQKSAHDVYSFMFISWLCGGALFLFAFIWIFFLLPRTTNEMIRSHLIFQRNTILYLVTFILALILCVRIFSISTLSIVFAVIFIIFWSLKRTFSGFDLLMKNQIICNPRTLKFIVCPLY